MSNPRNWKKHVVRCEHCGRLNQNIEHNHCPLGQEGSVVWLDLNHPDLGCGKCKRIWSLKENTHGCKYCDHVQKTDYVDAVLAQKTNVEAVVSDGELTHALLQSGLTLAQVRHYLGHGYEA